MMNAVNEKTRYTKRGLLLRGILPVFVAAALLCFAGMADAATRTVTSGGDTGVGTLRYVVENAASGDTIVFHSSVTTVNVNSYLFVNKALTITGPVTIKQTAGGRVLYVTGDCTFNNLTVTGGNTGTGSGSQGGGVINYANLTMNDCTVSGNSGGGGIHNGRSMTLNNCVIKDNSSSGSTKAGGISNTDYGYNATTLTMRNCVVENNTCTSGIAGGIYNGVKGTLSMYRCIVRKNVHLRNELYSDQYSSGGGLYLSSYATTNLADYCQVTENVPDQICCGYGVTYTTDGTCTIGDTAGKSAVALSGAAEGSSVKPRNTTGEADVTKVENDLKNRESTIFKEAENLLSTDLGGLPGGAAATLYDAFAYENVPLADTSGEGKLEVEFTASWPKNARYYAALAEYEDAAAGVQAVKGYAIPERSVRFEIKPGQPLPDGVTPPDFYEEGEGLMTWRNVVEDNGPFDHNRQIGMVTFRVASIRAEAAGDKGSGGGCNAAGGFAPLALLLVIPLAAPFFRAMRFERSGKDESARRA